MGKKSLSSSKKKRPRDSSQSRLRRKSASKISKSKRRKRRDDSGSSSSDSLSSSSSEDDYRRRKSRSGTRKKAKIIKKRSRRRSSSSDSGDSSDSSLVLKKKKKKRSKRKKSYEAKKRTRSIKKRRKDVSLSSASSESCPTSPNTDVNERKKGRYEDRDKETKELDMVTNQTKRSQETSRSCSLSGEGGEGDDYRYEEEITANSKKRLRSVIVMANNNISDGKNKEEIVSDHYDDYPASGSNDSNNDGGFKREYEYNHIESVEYMQVEHEKELEASSARRDESEPKDVLMEKSNQTSIDAKDLEGGDDLETILRRRALENLKRFRGPPKNSDASMNQTDRYDNEKTLGVADCESAEIKSENLTRHSVSTSRDLQVSAEKKLRANAGSVTNRPKLVRTVWRRESSDYSAGTKQATGSTTGANVGMGVLETPQTLTKKIVIDNSESNDSPQDRHADDTQMDASAGSNANRPKLVRSVWRRESSNLGDRIETAGPETSEAKANQASGSKDEQSTSQAKTETGHDETKAGSQFEQKTMSVMRGGEMVQVSYKVYIPKKTPALTRRVLKR